MQPDARIEVPSRRRRGRRRLIFVGGGVGLIVIAASFAWHTLLDPERLRSIVERELSLFSHGKMEIGAVTRVGLTELGVYGVTLFEAASSESPRSTAPGQAVFHCPEVRIRIDWRRFLLRRPSMISLLAVRPTCTILRDDAGEKTNLAGLARAMPAMSGAPDRLWPTFELQDARIIVGKRGVAGVTIIETLEATLRGRSMPGGDGTYRITWEVKDERFPVGQAIVDIASRRWFNVQGGLPSISLEAVFVALNTRFDRAASWSDLLGLQGRVRVSDYDFSQGPSSSAHSFAIIELMDARLSIPILEEEFALAPENRFLHFDAVDGAIEVRSGSVSAAFQGKLGAALCRANASFVIDGASSLSLADVAVEATMEIQGMPLPRTGPEAPEKESRLVEQLPRLAEIYRDFDPHGVVDLTFRASKSIGVGEKFHVSNFTVQVYGADASYGGYPYRVSDLQGELEFFDDNLAIRNLGGFHGETRVCIDGVVWSPSRCSPAEFIIHAEDLAIDNEAMSGLSPALQSSITEFHPIGNVDVDVQLQRIGCDELRRQNWLTKTNVHLSGISAWYDHLPYPVTQGTGTIVAEKDSIVFSEIRGRAGDAEIRMDGRIATLEDRVTDLDVVLEACDLPVDSRLWYALDKEARPGLDSLAASGRINTRTRLLRSAHQHHEQTEVAVVDGAAQLHSFPLPVYDLQGRLDWNGDDITLHEITGRHQSGRFQLNGWVDLSTEAFVVNVAAQDVPDGEAFRGALPQRLRNSLSDIRLEGGFDAVVRASFGDGTLAPAVNAPPPTTEGVAVQGSLVLSGDTLWHSSLPDPLTDVNARIEFSQSSVSVAELQCTYERAPLRASMEAAEDGDEWLLTGQLRLTDADLASDMENFLRRFAPNLLGSAPPKGTANLLVDDWTLAIRKGGGPASWSARGRVELHDASLGAASLRNIGGVVSFDARGGGGVASAEGELRLGSLTLLHRQLRSLRAPWKYRSNEAIRWEIAPIDASMYGGKAAGVLRFSDATPVGYSASATLYGVQLEPFLNASQEGDQEGAQVEPIDARGVLDAFWELEGSVDDSTNRRGVGRIHIDDAHLYRLPIMLSILHVINLTVPDVEAFDSADAEFLVTGNRVHVTDIRLDGSALSLVGAGTMQLPEFAVDLTLYNLGPRRFNRLPILSELMEGVSRELVELHVTGPISTPMVRAKPLGGLTQELKSIFRKKRPRNVAPLES